MEARAHSNPADTLSRGQSPDEFLHNSIWPAGPSWLAENKNNWPSTSLPILDIPKQRTIVVMQGVHSLDRNILSRFFSFNKMKKVISYCLRFIDHCRSRKSFVGDLSVGDLKRAEVRILRLIQLVSFKEMRNLSENRPLDKRSRLLTLNPFLDAEEILRVGGRLKM